MNELYNETTPITPTQHELFEGLNEPQREAVAHGEGPILILAGAGSGKTRVLTRRVAHLVLHHGVRPESILAVTFTNKATEEMKHRLHSLLGERAEQLWVATFHSASLRILRRHAPLLGYTNDFVVYDDDDCKSIIKSICKELAIDDKKYPAYFFSKAIDQAKNAFQLPHQFVGKGFSKAEDAMQQEVYTLYQQQLFKNNAMDFGDLLLNSVRVLQVPDVLRIYQRHIEFVLVDEYQDTNQVQYQFIRLLVAPRNNLLVVGDDDQSIYGFRGATIRNILEFERDYRGAKVVKLEQNYRSTGNILQAAHAVIEKNRGRKGKKLWTEAGAGELIRTYVGETENDEARFIASEIRRRLSPRGITITTSKVTTTPLEKVAPSDIAIFYRTNAQSRAIEEALIQQKIPYKIFGGLKFYDRKEVKDILAYLRLIVNEGDNQAFLRVVNTPPRGIGPQTLQTVVEQAKKEDTALLTAATTIVASGVSRQKGIEEFLALISTFRSQARVLTLSELVGDVITKTEYASKLSVSKDPQAQSRIENLKELQALARTLEKGDDKLVVLRDFLDRVSLTAGTDAPTQQSDGSQEAGAVSLMTLHLAKGLEFDLVFLTGVEEGLIPHYRSIDDATAIEEERRLCYVGITRARKLLFMTRSRQRGMFSSGDGFGLGGMYRDPSRFAEDIPIEVYFDTGQPFTGYGESGDLSEGGASSRASPSYGGARYGSPARLPQGAYNKAVSATVVRRHSDITPNSFSKRGAGEGAPQSITSMKPPPGAPLATKESLIAGVKVQHAVFGKGTVERIQDEGQDVEVYVLFENFEGAKKLMLKYAKLYLLSV